MIGLIMVHWSGAGRPLDGDEEVAVDPAKTATELLGTGDSEVARDPILVLEAVFSSPREGVPIELGANSSESDSKIHAIGEHVEITSPEEFDSKVPKAAFPEVFRQLVKSVMLAHDSIKDGDVQSAKSNYDDVAFILRTFPAIENFKSNGIDVEAAWRNYERLGGVRHLDAK